MNFMPNLLFHQIQYHYTRSNAPCTQTDSMDFLKNTNCQLEKAMVAAIIGEPLRKG